MNSEDSMMRAMRLLHEPSSSAAPSSESFVIPSEVFLACSQPATYDSHSLKGARSRADKAAVFDAVKIVRDIIPASGPYARPTASLAQISDAIDRGASFQIDEFRSTTQVRQKRFLKLFQSVNKGDATVNAESLDRFLKCAVVKSLATLQVNGNAKSATQLGFHSTYIQPVYNLYYSQQRETDVVNFPGRLSKLLRKARRQVKLHLPLYHPRFTLCNEMCELLIKANCAGADYYFTFNFHLSFVCTTGKRIGVTGCNKLEDIIEVIELFGDDGKKLKHRHFAVTLRLRKRDKNDGDSDTKSTVLVGSNAKRENVLDCVYHLEQLLIREFDMDLDELMRIIESGRGDHRMELPLIQYKRGNTINKLIQKNLERTTITKKLDLKIYQGRHSVMSKVQRRSEEDNSITAARLESLREQLG